MAFTGKCFPMVFISNVTEINDGVTEVKLRKAASSKASLYDELLPNGLNN